MAYGARRYIRMCGEDAQGVKSVCDWDACLLGAQHSYEQRVAECRGNQMSVWMVPDGTGWYWMVLGGTGWYWMVLDGTE